MPLAYLLDEHLRGLFYRYVLSHNARGRDPIDVLRVGDPPDLPLGAGDPDILIWAEQNQKIVLTRDVGTIPSYLAAHLASGHRSPGIFVLRYVPFPQAVEFLSLAAHASEPEEWEGHVEFVP